MKLSPGDAEDKRTKAMQLDERTFNRVVGPDVSMGPYPEDQRTADRVPLRRQAQFALLGEDGRLGRRTNCQVREISRIGAGLLTTVRLPEDAQLVLWLGAARAGEIAVQCNVMRIEPCGDSSHLFVVGIAFHKLYAPRPLAAKR